MLKKPFILLLIILLSACTDTDVGILTYEGTQGPGKGKHIVFIASDHEYRSEETCPALARLLAKHYGFKCSVLFGLDPKTGYIAGGSSYIPGMERLETADLMFCFFRFLNLKDEDMKYFDAYLTKAKPVIGLRTSTHGFRIKKNQNYSKYTFKNKDESYKNGFGRQVLGESWAGHYGRNHVSSTRLIVVPKQKKHPINSGVNNMHTKAGAYSADPMPNSIVLAMAQALKTMEANSAIDAEKKPTPSSWVRTYKNTAGQEGRVFTSTQGASEDILNEGYRRHLVNAVFWTLGLEDKIKPDSNISFVGPYNPLTFSNGQHRKNVKPADIAGWTTAIWSSKAGVLPKPPKKNKKKRTKKKTNKTKKKK